MAVNGIIKHFLTKKNLIIIPITYWMNRNKKPSNKENMFYFINAHLVPKFPSWSVAPEGHLASDPQNMPPIPALLDSCKHQLFCFLTDLDSEPHVTSYHKDTSLLGSGAVLSREPFLSGSSATTLQEPRTSHTIIKASVFRAVIINSHCIAGALMYCF